METAQCGAMATKSAPLRATAGGEACGISAKNWKDSDEYLWRPDIRPRMNDWISDFTLGGQTALDGPEWASRMVMFRLYYLGLTPY